MILWSTMCHPEVKIIYLVKCLNIYLSEVQTFIVPRFGDSILNLGILNTLQWILVLDINVNLRMNFSDCLTLQVNFFICPIDICSLHWTLYLNYQIVAC